MKFARRTFLITGLYGLLVLLPQYFIEAKNGRDFPPPVNHPEYYYGFIGVALAGQVLFLILSREPQRYRLMMLPAILEKVSFGLAVAVLYVQQRVGVPMLVAGAIDLIFAVLFILAYARVGNGKGSKV